MVWFEGPPGIIHQLVFESDLLQIVDPRTIDNFGVKLVRECVIRWERKGMQFAAQEDVYDF